MLVLPASYHTSPEMSTPPRTSQTPHIPLDNMIKIYYTDSVEFQKQTVSFGS